MRESLVTLVNICQNVGERAGLNCEGDKPKWKQEQTTDTRGPSKIGKKTVDMCKRKINVTGTHLDSNIILNCCIQLA